MKTICIGLLLGLCFACGKDDNKSESSSTEVPAASGTYAFITSDVSYKCTDNSTGTNGPISLNTSVTIDKNEIKINSTASSQQSSQSQSTAAGIDIQTSGYSGLVQSDNTFTATQSGSGTSPDIGKFSITYSLKGKITHSSWSGNYVYTLTAPEVAVSCTYTSSFSGDKQ